MNGEYLAKLGILYWKLSGRDDPKLEEVTPALVSLWRVQSPARLFVLSVATFFCFF